jgi:trehalose 6-phosphate synthase/phosphatase
MAAYEQRANFIPMKKRLIIVSNRLPITVDEEGCIKAASGGLITAINSYIGKDDKNYEEIYWAGIPGCSISTWINAIKRVSNTDFTYLPVFSAQETYNNYYNGFSNSVVWPLFHYFPSYAEYNATYFEHYKDVNKHFADALLKVLKPGDTVWVHDYHLLPLCAILRKEIPELNIGFFLHIPFPSYEIFRLLPKKWQVYLLQGVLGADLIGFHTIDYASHFLQSLSMVLGLDNERNIIQHDNRLIKIDVFPISIDYKKFNEGYDEAKVIKYRNAFLDQMKGRKIIFSVDRLDYTKGVHNRLKAYEYFLQQNPEYHNKVVFIMVIVPSRDSILKYAERKKEIDETISHINSKIGNIQWMPVIYQYNCLGFEEMLGLYTACDLALITPLRDGMNLVSKEFVASRKDKKGVLVISEMAGAARELTDALTINPNDIVEMSEKIKEGFEMSEQDQKGALENMQQRIANYNVITWANDFMDELQNIKSKQNSFQIKFIDEFTRVKIFDAYRNSKKRLLLLDYDGTLVPFSSTPDLATPGPELLKLVKELCNKKENNVFLISGRSSSWLENQFGSLCINLIAEHGARYKWKNSTWVTDIQTHNEWKEQVHTIMEMYVRRCANSMIEEKDFSMVWHFRNSNSEQGKLRSLELVSELNDYIRNRHLQVLMGNKIVEVRQSGINKGNFTKKIIEKESYDYIFAVGDDRTDEDMFKELMHQKNTYTIKVGPEASYAKYNLHTPQMVISFLQGFNHLSPGKMNVLTKSNIAS